MKKTRVEKAVKKAKELLKKKRSFGAAWTEQDLLSSGSTMLNLACTGNRKGAFIKGRFYFYVGESGGGKTFHVLASLAEAVQNPNFDNYDLIFDNPEDGALMDLAKFFGERLTQRLRAPKTVKGKPVSSRSVEDFYFNVSEAADTGRPFVYILDSMDALTADKDREKFEETKKASREGKKTAGTYMMTKQKLNSQYMPMLMDKLRQSGSILIMICQSRDNVGWGFEAETRGGGRAIKFYASLEIWASKGSALKKTVNGKTYPVGIVTKLRVKKNRITGRDRTVLSPIYYDYGIDDLRGCINFLIEHKHWKGSGEKVIAPEFDYKGSITRLIKKIEEEEEEVALRVLTQKVWTEIEQSLSQERKPRYQ